MAHVTVSSAEERHFTKEGIKYNTRNDGRSRDCFREIFIKTDIIRHLYSSAKINIGKTKVICSVSLKIGEPNLSYPEVGILDININPINKEVHSGMNRKKLNDYSKLSAVLKMAYGVVPQTLDLKSLCIIPGNKCWILNLDILVIEDDGNITGAAGLAIYSSLKNLKIPNVIVTESNGLEEIEIDDNISHACFLKYSALPLIMTFYIINDYYIVDATSLEEQCSDLRLNIAICPITNKIIMLNTDGDYPLSNKKMLELSNIAVEKIKQINLHLCEIYQIEKSNPNSILWI